MTKQEIEDNFHHNSYNSRWLRCIIRLILGAGILLLLFLIFDHFNIIRYFAPDNIRGLHKWINRFGTIGPVIYISLIAFAAVFFIPSLPLAIIGGIMYGPVLGTLYVSLGSTLGASVAFLISRYAARSLIEQIFKNNPILHRIDKGVQEKGWKMLILTRFVPVIPFHVQNYIYGLTKIDFFTYIILTWLCLLPGVVIYVMAGGLVLKFLRSLEKIRGYLRFFLT